MQAFYIIHALWGMSRPLQLLAVFLVYTLGTLVANAQGTLINPIAFSSGLIVLLLVAASIHYANEYADYETDALTTRTPFSGGSGALVWGHVPRRLALQAAWVMLASGIIIALFYFNMGALPLVAFIILILGAFGGWMYSLPPLQLAWCGWGELDNAFLGGMLLPLYGYAVQTGMITQVVILSFLPFMLLVFLNLLATTWPDRRADAQVGKFTLATRWPIPRLRILYGVVAVGALIILILCLNKSIPLEVVIGSLVVIPLVGWSAISYTRIENPQSSVMSMVVLLLLQIATWSWVGFS